MACSKPFTNDEIKGRIKNIWSKFVSGVDPERLSDWLVQENVITTDQWQRVQNNNPTHESRCRAMLHHLFSIPHPKAFLVVYQALVKEDHYLIKDIDDQEPGSGISSQHDIQIVLQAIEKAEQQEKENKDKTSETDKDRLLKMQSEYEDQKRAWGDERDRLLKRLKDNETTGLHHSCCTELQKLEQERSMWHRDKQKLLQVIQIQNERIASNPLWTIERLSAFVFFMAALFRRAFDFIFNDDEQDPVVDKVFISPQDLERIANLNPDQVSRIKHVADIYRVQVEVDLSQKRIRVRGPSSVITHAIGHIHQIIKEARTNEITMNEEEGKLGRWEYEDGSSFEKYPDEINAIIEEAHRQSKPCVEWEKEDEKYRLTFSEMLEECVTKSEKPPVKVRRVAKDQRMQLRSPTGQPE